jgi:hypothetical protein
MSFESILARPFSEEEKTLICILQDPKKGFDFITEVKFFKSSSYLKFKMKKEFTHLTMSFYKLLDDLYSKDKTFTKKFSDAPAIITNKFSNDTLTEYDEEFIQLTFKQQNYKKILSDYFQGTENKNPRKRKNPDAYSSTVVKKAKKEETPPLIASPAYLLSLQQNSLFSISNGSEGTVYVEEKCKYEDVVYGETDKAFIKQIHESKLGIQDLIEEDSVKINKHKKILKFSLVDETNTQFFVEFLKKNSQKKDFQFFSQIKCEGESVIVLTILDSIKSKTALLEGFKNYILWGESIEVPIAEDNNGSMIFEYTDNVVNITPQSPALSGQISDNITGVEQTDETFTGQNGDDVGYDYPDNDDDLCAPYFSHAACLHHPNSNSQHNLEEVRELNVDEFFVENNIKPG